jgi:hypothetical protein
MRSTSGAYGDFPDYYYKSGNLFGSYLLGKAAPMSRDTRRELEALEGGYPVIRPAPRLARPQEKATPHAALMNYVRASVTPDGARRIVAALAQHRGLTVPELSTADAYDLLDKFAIENLTPRDQLRVRIRLEKARDVAAEERRRRQRSAKRPQKSKAESQSKSRKRPPSAPTTSARNVAELAKQPTTCALCGATLTRLERTRCAREPRVFLSQAYCAEHADRVRALFAKQN